MEKTCEFYKKVLGRFIHLVRAVS
ncbi:hypothetical protein [Cytobacillus pseudoceanisediminis]